MCDLLSVLNPMHSMTQGLAEALWARCGGRLDGFCPLQKEAERESSSISHVGSALTHLGKA